MIFNHCVAHNYGSDAPKILERLSQPKHWLDLSPISPINLNLKEPQAILADFFLRIAVKFCWMSLGTKISRVFSSFPKLTLG